jgi:hypothetical protein
MIFCYSAVFANFTFAGLCVKQKISKFTLPSIQLSIVKSKIIKPYFSNRQKNYSVLFPDLASDPFQGKNVLYQISLLPQ